MFEIGKTRIETLSDGIFAIVGSDGDDGDRVHLFLERGDQLGDLSVASSTNVSSVMRVTINPAQMPGAN
ncbi:MAG TPA: hypothetical protein VF452_05290 [Candidatus Binatia bacterium]